MGPVLRRYYLNVPRDMEISKPVNIDGVDYPKGQLSERDLFKIYFKKNLILWADRYEDEFFHDKPETNVDIQSSEEAEVEDLSDVSPDSPEEEVDINDLL